MLLCIHLPPAWSQLAPDTQGENQRYVSIDFNNVDMQVFIKFISELTGKNFVVDRRINGKVTIISPNKISVDEAFKVFESVLEVYGFAAVSSGNLVKIIPRPDAKTKSIETRLRQSAKDPGDTVVTQLIPLKYADPLEIKKLFAPIVSKASVILAYPQTNTLIVTDVHSNIQRLLRILKVIDVAGIGRELTVIPLRHANAPQLVQLLSRVFASGRPAKKGELEQIITFVADERTNTLVLHASEDDTKRAKKLIAMLDKEMPRGKDNIHVHYLEHATAVDLAKVLQALSINQAREGSGRKEAPVISGRVKITPDKATNSLIIMANKDDYQVLQAIIQKLDIPRAMVYIEALIMEVNVDKDFRLGTEWAVGGETSISGNDGAITGGFSGGASGGDPGFNTLPGVGELLPPGFSIGIFEGAIEIETGFGPIKFPNIGAVIQAYKKDKDVNILSTPQILTTDNQEAKITVGKNLPFQTRTSTTDNETYNTFEYRDVGKTLQIRPQISKDRMVRLNIALEVTELESTTDFRPTTLKRTIDTTVIVKDNNTVVIGGLIDDTTTETDYQIPCLGEVPMLGWAFKSESTVGTKTNLFVFLTPQVIKNPAEAQVIQDEKKDQIDEIREGRIKLYDGSPATDESPEDKPLSSVNPPGMLIQP